MTQGTESPGATISFTTTPFAISVITAPTSAPNAHNVETVVEPAPIAAGQLSRLEQIIEYLRVLYR
jgi:hypothetical protein